MQNILICFIIIILLIVFLYFALYEETKSVEPKPLELLKNRPPKFNFVTNGIISVEKHDLEDYKITLEITSFKMFQIWSEFDPKVNKDRKVYLIDTQSLINLMQNMKKKENFQPTIYFLYDGNYYFTICKSVKMLDNKMELSCNSKDISFKRIPELHNVNVSFYIDSISYPVQVYPPLPPDQESYSDTTIFVGGYPSITIQPYSDTTTTDSVKVPPDLE